MLIRNRIIYLSNRFNFEEIRIITNQVRQAGNPIEINKNLPVFQLFSGLPLHQLYQL